MLCSMAGVFVSTIVPAGRVESKVVCSIVRAGLSWVLLYRTESYKRRKDAIERLQKKGERVAAASFASQFLSSFRR